MGDIKPLGSEKLIGEEKLKRIIELTYYGQNKTVNENKSLNGIVEFTTDCKTGGVYGIVKEKDGYYVKRGINESSLDYIGGMFMKNKNKFPSYADSLKRLNLLKGQEELNEATKYVLKQNKPSTEAPAPSMGDDETPTPDAPPVPSDMGNEGDDMGGEGMDDMNSDEGTKPSEYMSEIQKFCGKLGQELRDQKERLVSDDIKYVLNMIISAVNLDKLDDNDLDDVVKKFDREEKSRYEDDDMDNEDDYEDSDNGDDEEEDLSEIEGIGGLEEFFNSDFDQNELDLSKYEDLNEDDEEEEDDIQEIDLDEINNELNNSIGQILGKYFKK